MLTDTISGIAIETPTIELDPGDPPGLPVDLTLARKRLRAVISFLDTALRHTARAHVSLNRAPATYTAGQLRLSAGALRTAKGLLEAAMALPGPDIPGSPFHRTSDDGSHRT